MGNLKNKIWAKALVWILIGGSVLSVFISLLYAIM